MPLFRIFLILCSFAGVTSAFAATNTEIVLSKDSSLTWSQLVQETPTLSARVSGAFPADLQSSDVQCTLRAYRPNREDGFQWDSDNSMHCLWSEKDRATRRFKIDFSDVGMAAWGSMSDRKPVRFDETFSVELFEILMDAYSRNTTNEMYDTIALCGPDEYCVEGYIINSFPSKDSMGAIICDRRLHHGVVENTECKILSLN